MDGFGAVVFDLFGTLTTEYTIAYREEMLRAMTAVLGVDHDAFVPPWDASEPERLTGQVTLAGNLLKVCAGIGEPCDEVTAARAVEARRPFLEPFFATPSSILETLRVLRGHKELRLGLVSACTGDVPALFAASPMAGLFDATVFSCEVGLMKPDPAIYRVAIDALELPASACLYIGDGSFGELHGAQEAGMTAALVRTAAGSADGMHRPAEREWTGEVIGSIPEVLRLIC